MIGALIVWAGFWIAVLGLIALGLRLAWRAVRALERRETERAELAGMQLRLDQLESTVDGQARELRRLAEGAEFTSQLGGGRPDAQRGTT